MSDLFNTEARNPGPAVLGHDPVVLPGPRERVKDAVNETGVVNFRDDPALPFIENPNR